MASLQNRIASSERRLNRRFTLVFLARLSLLNLCIALVLLPSSVRAQGTPDTAIPESEVPDVATPDGATPESSVPEVEAPVDPKFAEAKERFLQGVKLAKAGNCEGAIAELKASYDLVARTNTLFNIAQCHEELFQYNLAIAAYDRFLEVAEDDEQDRARVEATIRSLRNLLGTLVIKSNVKAEVWLGDRKIGGAPGKILIPGGRHEVELRAEGYLATRKEVVIAGREEVELNYNLIIAQKKITITKIENRGLDPSYFWGGVTATGLVSLGGVYFGVRAKLEDSAARDIYPRLPRDEEQDDIKTLANVADILFLTAGAFAVGTTVTYFLTDWDISEESQSLSLVPTLGPNSIGLSFGGRL